MYHFEESQITNNFPESEDLELVLKVVYSRNLLVILARGAREVERCDISRSIYGISSSYRGARNIEKCDISRSIYGISNTPT